MFLRCRDLCQSPRDPSQDRRVELDTCSLASDTAGNGTFWGSDCFRQAKCRFGRWSEYEGSQDAIRFGFASFVAIVGLVLHAQSIEITPKTILEAHNVIAKPVEYRGKNAMEIRDAAPQPGDELSES